jgi:hypothetical protein
VLRSAKQAKESAGRSAAGAKITLGSKACYQADTFVVQNSNRSAPSWRRGLRSRSATSKRCRRRKLLVGAPTRTGLSMTVER